MFEPGIACRTAPNASIGANWTSLGNWSGSTQTAWCPLIEDDYQADLNVDVTSGWASTQSCYVAYMATPTNGYWYNPTSIVNQSAGYDTVYFNLANDTTGSAKAEVQCNLPNNQMILDYNEQIAFAFNSL